MATVPRTENGQRPRDQRSADEGRRALNLVERWALLTRAHVEMRTGSRPLSERDGPSKARQGNRLETAAEPI